MGIFDDWARVETELRRISRWWNVNQSATERLGSGNEIEVKIPRARDTWLFKPSCMMNGFVQGGEQEILDSEHGGPPTLSVLHSSSGRRGISLPSFSFTLFLFFLFPFLSFFYYYYCYCFTSFGSDGQEVEKY